MSDSKKEYIQSLKSRKSELESQIEKTEIDLQFMHQELESIDSLLGLVEPSGAININPPVKLDIHYPKLSGLKDRILYVLGKLGESTMSEMAEYIKKQEGKVSKQYISVTLSKMLKDEQIQIVNKKGVAKVYDLR